MRKSSGGHVIGVPVTSKAYAIEEATRDGAVKKDGDRLAVSLTHPSPYTSFGYKHSSKGQVIHWVNKLGRRAQGFRDHVTLGPKLSETVKGKLSLGARILQAGGVERDAGVPAGLLGREGRAAGEGPPVLPLHHQRPHRRDALRLHPQDRLPQRPVPHRHLPGRRRRPSALQGDGPPEEDQEDQAERERREAGAEIHTHGDCGRVRVLVHGVRQLPEMLQLHAAGDLRAVMARCLRSLSGRRERSMLASCLALARSEVCGLRQRLVGTRVALNCSTIFLRRARSFLLQFGSTGVWSCNFYL